VPEPGERLHPIYRWLAGILGSAALGVQPLVVTGPGSFVDKLGLFLGGVGIGTLFLYCAITGRQYDYKSETDDG